MTSQAISILRIGLVTSVGMSAPTACAAYRAKVSNPSLTRVTDSHGEWINAHRIQQLDALVGRARLAKMAQLAIAECISGHSSPDWGRVPLLLCVAERQRPGRVEALNDCLMSDVQQLLGIEFAPTSSTIAHGRVGVCVALTRAREMILAGACRQVLVVATDSLLERVTLEALESAGRVLTSRNSNGFVPGEAAGALLVGPGAGSDEMLCQGLGFGLEAAHLSSGEPLRAEGLAVAIKTALVDAGREMHDIDYRLADLSGEHYYFKEASLALSRTLRQRKPEFDIWHPAECFGETGAASGVAIFAVIDAAARKGFAPGPWALIHLTNDDGARAAAVVSCGVVA